MYQCCQYESFSCTGVLFISLSLIKFIPEGFQMDIRIIGNLLIAKISGSFIIISRDTPIEQGEEFIEEKLIR